MKPAATIAATVFFLSAAALPGEPPSHIEGEMAGEVTQTSVILQSRLTVVGVDESGDVPGARGVARFEIADNRCFDTSRFTPWLEAAPESDFIVKAKVADLKPATQYYYRLEFGPDRQRIERGPARRFHTHPSADTAARCSIVVVTGMNYHHFHYGVDKRPAYAGPDKHLGYPALVSMLKRNPDFFVGTGDNVYYDAPPKTAAQTAAAMRKKWHEQFVQPRYIDFFAKVPTYWEKDDHDYRYNDCDNTGDKPPSVELGLSTFREQVPITDPADRDAVTYRTHRIGKLVQIWLTENRDYRSPNRSPDGPQKTIWGRQQRDWLQDTLLESDAVFKILISPTPMIGPDDAYKRDNHCNIDGFRHERDSFFAWAKTNGLLEKGFYLVCGDRHWQYHSIDPSGFEEFSTGALVDANARLGVPPGSPRGTDRDANIRQPYTSREPSGGYLNVVVEADDSGKIATAQFDFFDENGDLLHTVSKTRDIR